MHCLRSAFLATVLAFAPAGADESAVQFDPHKHTVWIPVRINGGPELNFALDTAAVTSAIDWDRAMALKLAVNDLGQRYAGSGDGTARVGQIGRVSLTFPGATLELSEMGVVPLRGVSESFGRKMDGVVGAELLDRFVVELDWETEKLALHAPAGYRYRGSGTVIPLVLRERKPFVRLSVSVGAAAPVDGMFLVDCPFAGNIIMNRPFVEQHGLLELARCTLPRMVAQFAEGVGGKSEVYYGRVAALQLGPFKFPAAVAGFSAARAGSLARESFSGILGAGILRRFHVIFDCSRERMILEPKARWDEPARYDASGLRLRAAGQDLRDITVLGTIEKSPAEAAGIQAGDRIVAIDGTPANTLTLGAIQDRLKREGATVRLGIARAGRGLEVNLRLQQLI